MSEKKTNAMRILDRLGVEYKTLYYTIAQEDFSGEAVAALLGADPDRCLKTLCTKNAAGEIFVFSLPVRAELDLKKAAAAAGEKRLELMHVRDLKAATGYERGGVSPIGLKKPYPVFIDETATLFARIEVSGGARGCSVELAPEALALAAGGVFADVTAL